MLDKGEKQYAEHQIILHHKFYKENNIHMKLMFGHLALFCKSLLK